MLHFIKNKYSFLLVIAIAIFITGVFIEEQSKNVKKHGLSVAEKAELIILEKDAEVKEFLSLLESKLGDKSKSVHLPLFLEEITQQAPPNLTCFVNLNDSLIFWSDNLVPFSRSLVDNANKKFIFHKNGWYLNYVSQIDNYTINGLYLIKHEYPFENNYLKNEFNPSLKIPENFKLITSEGDSTNTFSINYDEQKVLFSIAPIDNQNIYLIKISRAIYYLAVVILFIYLILIIQFFRHAKWWQVGLVLLTIISIRLITIYFQFPEAVYGTQVFSPSYYATSYLFNSLGDLTINTLIILLFILILYQVWRYTKITVRARNIRPWLISNVIIMLWIASMYSALAHYLISTLVLNSNISFDWSNIFELTGYSIIGFIIIAFLLLGLYLLCDDSIRLIRKTEFKYTKLFYLYVISIVLFLLTWLLFKNRDLFSIYSLSPFVLTHVMLWFIFLTRKVTLHKMSFTRTLSAILICALFTSYTLNKYIQIKEQDERSLFASKLSNEEDIIAEYLFSDVIEKATKDQFITTYFDAFNNKLQNPRTVESVVSKRLQQLYFTGYWYKYDLVIHCYDKFNIKIKGVNSTNESYASLQSIIQNKDNIAGNKNFHFINNRTTRLEYIGIIPVNDANQQKLGTVIIELKSKFLKSSPGFPDLLLTKNIQRNPLKKIYSYAMYEGKNIQFQSGEYPYLFESDQYELKYKLKPYEKVYKNENGYSHLYYKPLPSTLIIVSKPLSSILDLITPFSYLFTFFCLLFFLTYFIVIAIRSKFQIHLNLKNRIQISIISIVVLSITVLGGGTIFYIYKSYSDTQNIKVAQQVSNLSQTIESDITTNSLLSETNRKDLQSILHNLSISNEGDFNLFDKNGKLLFSTQPNIFEKNILSSYMNPTAYNELEYKSGSRYIHFEKAGELQFMSAYEPIKGTNESVIGYINFPYFAREDELKREISTFLVALINIYVLLFSLAVLVTFFVANRITKPLRLIQKKLSSIRLGRRNELIVWNKDDEIGLLVKEYNRMVQELAVSADLLGKSERETAWREMAKQVAHEIKNPLTPMKLSLQHLQRAYHDKRDNMDETIQKLSKTIIEQIDTLSNIANEFSNFAQMPKANNMSLDLNMILKNTVMLYRDEDGVSLTYNSIEDKAIMVYADKDHMNRVFNNLIANAIQSIPEGQRGEVKIEVALNRNTHYCISIKDNGVGIPEDMLNNIFRPNFTTKTGGTGLGLAMSKNIIETSGGKIWFETEINIGTTFFVELPKLN